MGAIKHTPGPWVAVGYWVENPDDEAADICNCDPASMGQEHFGRSDEEIVANARLIAAAPTLLEALCDMVSDRDELSDATVQFAMNAIEQAVDGEFFDLPARPAPRLTPLTDEEISACLVAEGAPACIEPNAFITRIVRMTERAHTQGVPRKVKP